VTGGALPADIVAAASREWVWVPDNAVTIETPEYLLVRMPEWFEIPLELLRLDPVRPVDVVVDEVLDRARELGPPEVNCWVKLGADPTLDDVFRARGGVLDETLAVLALDLSPGLPDLGRWDTGLELRWVTDVATARDHHRVGVEVFGGSMAPDEELERAAADGRRQLPAGEGGSVVAYLEGTPVGAAGISQPGSVTRLWGGAVSERARGRGVYRALLDARIRYGREHGATMALVKGRVQTSGPILHRAGFARYGEERSYRVPLHG
jgi:GNAT superfamily N-acetyltransferase